QAVEVAKAAGIAIYARATAAPLAGDDPSVDGTVVRKHAPRVPGTVVGVASERDVLVLHATSDSLDVLALLDEHGVGGKQLHVAAERLTLVISRENLHEEGRVRAAVQSRLGAQARIVDTLAAVSVVGGGINASFRNLRRGSDVL